MYIIAGLGNPTKKYEKTRHNMGFDCIDKLAAKYRIRLRRSRFQALVGKGVIEGEAVLLVKPLTFMNLSGQAIGRIAEYLKADVEKDLIVIYDDTDLDVGKIRIKAKGSAGGHNGMKSIISCVRTEAFKRIRIGIGKREDDTEMIDFVLGTFSGSERKLIEEAQDNAADAVEDILKNGIEHAMNMYN